MRYDMVHYNLWQYAIVLYDPERYDMYDMTYDMIWCDAIFCYVIVKNVVYTKAVLGIPIHTYLGWNKEFQLPFRIQNLLRKRDFDITASN